MTSHPQLKSVRIQGYRPFGDFRAKLGALEVLVGANSEGGSSRVDEIDLTRRSDELERLA
jgi:predicted ATP-dependent endonuclease of OLD family